MSETSSPKEINYPMLEKGNTVKNLEDKKLGKPTIFIGSTRESVKAGIVDYIKNQFAKNLFEVDSWDSGIFGPVDENTTNIHWLKNFTDIYDFAIFLFTPDDKIVSQTRKNEKGEMLEGVGTRHNIVFEFGLFLGRIGSKKTYILFDKEIESFVNDFFTDLKGSSVYSEKNFIRLYDYEGNDKESLKDQVIKIQKNILETVSNIEIGFLPSTALAIGYFNNFLKIVIENINKIRLPQIPEEIIEKCSKDAELKRTVDLILNAKNIQIKILIPDKLIKAKHEEFKKDYMEAKLDEVCVPGITRNMTAYRLANNEDFIICDVPSTINSSIDAVELINPEDQIKELLGEKEIRNFTKAITYLIMKGNVQNITNVCPLEDFKKSLS